MSMLAGMMRDIALNAMKESKPVQLALGQVISLSPLQINVEGLEKPVTEEFLQLSHLVQDHKVYMTVDHQTEDAALVENLATDYKTHLHDYKGKKIFTLHYGLKVGEAVLLLRMQGGQQYFVLDRLAGDIL